MTGSLWGAEKPVLAGMKAAIVAGVAVEGTPLRVDVSVPDGPIVAPMALLEPAPGQGWERPAMNGQQLAVRLPVRVVVFGQSLAQANAIRGAILRELAGRDSHGWWAPLTVTGMVVLDREVRDVDTAREGGNVAVASAVAELLAQDTP